MKLVADHLLPSPTLRLFPSFCRPLIKPTPKHLVSPPWFIIITMSDPATYDYHDDAVPSPKQAAARASRLNFLLEKSTIYAKIIGDRMERQQIDKQKAEQRAEVRKANKEKRSKEGAEASRTGLRDKKEAEVETQAGTKRKRGKDGAKESKKLKVEVSCANATLTAG